MHCNCAECGLQRVNTQQPQPQQQAHKLSETCRAECYTNTHLGSEVRVVKDVRGLRRVGARGHRGQSAIDGLQRGTWNATGPGTPQRPGRGTPPPTSAQTSMTARDEGGGRPLCRVHPGAVDRPREAARRAPPTARSRRRSVSSSSGEGAGAKDCRAHGSAESEEAEAAEAEVPRRRRRRRTRRRLSRVGSAGGDVAQSPLSGGGELAVEEAAERKAAEARRRRRCSRRRRRRPGCLLTGGSGSEARAVLVLAPRGGAVRWRRRACLAAVARRGHGAVRRSVARCALAAPRATRCACHAAAHGGAERSARRPLGSSRGSVEGELGAARLGRSRHARVGARCKFLR